MEIVDYLLQQGTTIDVQDDEGWTCLMWGCLAGQLEVVELLIQEWGMAAEYSSFPHHSIALFFGPLQNPTQSSILTTSREEHTALRK